VVDCRLHFRYSWHKFTRHSSRRKMQYDGEEEGHGYKYLEVKVPAK